MTRMRSMTSEYFTCSRSRKSKLAAGLVAAAVSTLSAGDGSLVTEDGDADGSEAAGSADGCEADGSDDASATTRPRSGPEYVDVAAAGVEAPLPPSLHETSSPHPISAVNNSIRLPIISFYGNANGSPPPRNSIVRTRRSPDLGSAVAQNSDILTKP